MMEQLVRRPANESTAALRFNARPRSKRRLHLASRVIPAQAGIQNSILVSFLVTTSCISISHGQQKTHPDTLGDGFVIVEFR